MSKKLFLSIFLIILVFSYNLVAQYSLEDEEYYEILSVWDSGDWLRSFHLFNSFLKKYPNTRYKTEILQKVVCFTNYTASLEISKKYGFKEVIVKALLLNQTYITNLYDIEIPKVTNYSFLLANLITGKNLPTTKKLLQNLIESGDPLYRDRYKLTLSYFLDHSSDIPDKYKNTLVETIYKAEISLENGDTYTAKSIYADLYESLDSIPLIYREYIKMRYNQLFFLPTENIGEESKCEYIISIEKELNPSRYKEIQEKVKNIKDKEIKVTEEYIQIKPFQDVEEAKGYAQSLIEKLKKEGIEVKIKIKRCK